MTSQLSLPPSGTRPIGRFHASLLRLAFTALVVLLASFPAQEVSAAAGGPDAFGYIFTDSAEPGGPVTSFEDISATGTSVTFGNTDDAQISAAIGFDFSFYGTVYTASNICTNGFIAFNETTTAYAETVLPNVSLPNNMIAGWWDDLNVSAAGAVYYQTLGSAPNRRFIVQFKNVEELNSPANLNTFEFKLFEGGNQIEIHYQAVSTTTGATIGIENSAGTVGLQYFNGTGTPPIGGGPFAVSFSVPHITVTNTNDSGAGSLRQAIADIATGGTITFDPGLSGGTITFGSSLSISKALTIDASALALGLTLNNAGNTIHPDGGHVTLDTLTIEAGGNIAIEKFGSSPLTIRNSTITGSTGSYAIGAFSSSPLTISNTTITGNGGGLYIFTGGATATITNCTIVGNGSTGIILEDGDLVIENSIVAGNGAGQDFAFSPGGSFSPTLTPVGRNLIGDNTTVATEFPAGPLVGTTASPLDPLLSPLGDHGGPTQTMLPLTGSPAIDPVGGATTSSLTTDQRGFPRVADGNIPSDGTATVDIGAVEVAPLPTAITVTNTNDSGVGSLRQAIADIADGGTITFDPGVSGGTITLGGTALTINKTLTIDASSLSGGITIDANGIVTNHRVFEIAAGNTVTMDSLSITGGKTSGTGAGIQNAGVLNLNRSTVYGNTTPGNYGGGIHVVAGGSLTATNCTITGNFAFVGGGVMADGAASLIQTTVAANSADYGGGVWNASLAVTITNTILAGNTSPNSPDLANGATQVGNNLVGGSPMLASLGDYGGPTQTMPPLVGSPAIDAGGSSAIVTDQRGFPRPFGAAIDIGAVETSITGASPAQNAAGTSPPPTLAWSGAPGASFEVFIGTTAGSMVSQGAQASPFVVTTPLALSTTYFWRVDSTVGGTVYQGPVSSFTTRDPIVVTTLIDENDGLATGGVSLREAIAGAVTGETLTFAAGLSGGTINLIGDQLYIAKDINIDASSLPAAVTVAAPPNIKVFSIDTGRTVTMTSLTVTSVNPDPINVASGGIQNYGDLTLNRVTVTGNSNTSGGGITNNGTLTINDSTISNNRANHPTSGYGGAIHNTGILVINRSTLSNNYATERGGAIHSYNDVTLNNTTLSGNYAVATGGAIANSSSGVVRLRNSTVANNVAENFGGGITLSSGTLELSNSIIAGNSADVDGPDLYNSFAPAPILTGVNLIQDPQGSANLGTLGVDYLVADPLLAPLGDYGGPTQTMPPAVGSPAIDTGGATALLTDQRGASRVVGPGTDIGAVEALIFSRSPGASASSLSPLPTFSWSGAAGATFEIFIGTSAGSLVSQGGQSSPFTPPAALGFGTAYFWRIDTTLGGEVYAGEVLSFTTRPELVVDTLVDENDGIEIGGISLRDAINAAVPGETITFAPGLSGQTLTLGGAPLPIDQLLTIDASGLTGGITLHGGNASLVFTIGAGGDVILNTLTITGGSGGVAEAIDNLGVLTLLNSTLFGNTGGLGAISNSGTLTVSNCTITGNQGGIWIDSGDITVRNSSIINNDQWGGVYANGTANLIFENSIFAGNSTFSPSEGEDIVVRSGLTSITKIGLNIVGGNTSVETAFPADGLLVGTSANPVDPKLAPLANYGGPTPTMMPLPGSPAIDPSGGATTSSFTNDQRGLPRLVDGSNPPDSIATLDIGAVEAPAITIVENTNDSGPKSLRAALSAIPDGGGIVFDLTEFDGSQGPIALSSELSIIDRFVVIDASNIPGGVTVSGGAAVRVFHIDASGSMTLNHAHVTDGHVSGASGGGGIYNEGGTLTLIDSSVQDCVAAGSGPGGGGIYSEGTLTLSGSDISGNSASSGSGGGIYSNGDLTLTDSEVSNNTLATGAGVRSGGGIHMEAGNLTVTRGTISGNTADYGGGIYMTSGTGMIRQSTLDLNTARQTGGALRHIAGTVTLENTKISSSTAIIRGGGIDTSGGTLNLTRSTLSGNSVTGSGNGGGVAANGGAQILDHVTLSGNSANGQGGGIYSGAALTITHSTISDNSVTGLGGGIYVLSSPPTLNNVIVAGNTSSGVNSYNISGATPNGSNNLTGSGVPPTGSNNLTTTDPRLAPLGDYGGPTQTMPPLSGSPAIDAGAASAALTDQRGLPRVIGGASDIGAAEALITGISPVLNLTNVSPLPPLSWSGAAGATYELFIGTSSGSLVSQGIKTSPFTPPANLAFGTLYFWRIDTTLDGAVYSGEELSFTTRPESVVNTLVDENDGLDSGDVSLRDAIAAAVPGETITFDPLQTDGGTITLTQGPLLIDQDLTIDASSLGTGLTIDAGGFVPHTRVLEIAVGRSAVLNSLMITGGSITGDDGGGIMNHGALTLENSTVFGNYADQGKGGGIYNQPTGTLAMTSCTVTDNTAYYGGGIYSKGTVTLSQSTLSANHGLYGAGGVWNDTGTLTLNNTIVAGNTSSADLNITGSFTGTNNLIDVVPLLAPLGSYGGPTRTMPPQQDSPAINMGGSTSLLTDQRGFPRVIGGTVDIGACEAGSAEFNTAGLTVTTQGAANLTLLEISTDSSFLQSITTIMGSGTTGDFADGPKASARFSYPSDVARDNFGNLFIADTVNQRIRMVTPSGVVSTIAGTGGYGFVDGSGPSAKFAFPSAVAVTSGGNIVYVSDTFNHRIRKLTKPAVVGQSWTVTTLAGTGVAGLTEGADLTELAGSVSRFNQPHGLTLDTAGNLYVADSLNHRIRKVTPAGMVSTYAGTGPGGGSVSEVDKAAASFNAPFGVAFDSVGNLFVADRDNHRIRRIDKLSGLVTVFAGSGVAALAPGTGTAAQFHSPVALAFDSSDNLYVADQGNHAIRMVSPGAVVTTLIGDNGSGFMDGNSSVAKLDTPSGLVVDPGVGGGLIVADTQNHRLRRISINPITVPVTYAAGTGTLSAVIDAAALGLAPGQTYYYRWLPSGGGTAVAGDSFYLLPPPLVVTAPATTLTSTQAQLNATVDPMGSTTEVKFEYSTDPEVRGPWQVDSLLEGFLDDPRGVVVVGNSAFVADSSRNAIYRMDFGGAVSHFAGANDSSPGFVDGSPSVARFDGPAGMAADAEGNLYVADRLNHRIRRIDNTTGDVTTLAGSGLAGFADGAGGSARFYFPEGVAVFGNNVYVADTNNHRIRRIDKTTGAVTTLAGTGVAGFADGAGGVAQFKSPRTVGVTATGQIHVADTGNHRIRLITAGSSVVTLAGSGTDGFLNGAGTSARFSSPSGMVIGADGMIYITDLGNHRIRRVTPAGVVSTLAGSGIAGFLNSPTDALHPATDARFDQPGGIAMDSEGNLVVTEEGNAGLRSIARGAVPMVVATSNMIAEGSVSADTDQILLPGATYYFRAVATNSRESTVGGILSFVTPQSDIVVHNGPTSASPNLVPGQVIDFGTTPFSTPVVRSFTIENIGNFSLSVNGISLIGTPSGVYSLSGQVGNFLVAENGGTSLFSVTLNHAVAGTFENTVRIVSNDLDQEVIEFIVTGTVLAPPLLTDVSTSSVTALGVTFGATVNPQGSATDLLFEYSKYSDFAGALEVLTTAGSVQGFANGCGDDAQFHSPSGVAIDRFGNIYVADTLNHLIRRISANGDCGVLAGAGVAGLVDGPGVSAKFNAPEGLAVDASGNVYVADTQNHRIRKITPAGEVTTLAGYGSSGSFTDGAIGGARFNLPAGIAIDALGNLFVADSGNNRIRMISTAGEVSTLAGPTGYNAPKGVAVDRDGRIIVADTGNDRIVELTSIGDLITSHVTGFSGPTGVAVDASGRIYVADRARHRIARIDSGGVVTNLAGTPDVSGANDGAGDGPGEVAGFNLPSGVAVSPSGTIYVADFNNDRIRQINLAARRVVAASHLTVSPEDPVTLAVVGLEPSTTYYFRGIAINGGGTVYTLPVEPVPLTFTTLDNNAELGSLSLNGDPVLGFNPCVYSYPVTVDPPQNAMVILAEAESPDAMIKLYQNGSYVADLESGVQSASLPLEIGLNQFQISVTSADGTTSRTYLVAATLVQPDSPFAQWQALKFGGNATNPLIAGALANPDNDGSVNLLEYAFDLDPNNASSVDLPVVGHAGGFLTLTYRRRVGATDIAYVVEWSTNLIDWSDVGVTEELVTPQGEGLTEEILGKIPDGGPSKFLRVSVHSL